MPRLNRSQLPHLSPAVLPRTGPDVMTIGIVHLGIGAFHRAHQAVFTQRAMDLTGETNWGICGVSQRGATATQTLDAQDCLYSVTEALAERSTTAVVAAVRQALFAQEQWAELGRLMASPSTSVITLTVSEKGYRMYPSTRRLLGDDPEVAADAQGRDPSTVVGQLARGLQQRALRGGPPITVVCCDNMPANGATLRQLFLDFCQMLPSAEADALVNWAQANTSFPSCVVDRIVPASTPQDRELAARALGVEDEAAVVTEPFAQWTIEDSFASPRPAWERVGASLVQDVAPYEQMKLRLLNGSHSALAYLGALAGHERISDAVAAPGFEAYVQLLMDVDLTPTLDVPAHFDLGQYKQSLRERFANRALRHRTTQIAMDGSQKLPYRLVSAAAERLEEGEVPRYIALAIAGWMRFVSAGRDDHGRALRVDDPMADRIQEAVAGTTTAAEVVSALLGWRRSSLPP